jgi:RNA polymerase sigma-70 factor (ECF subfamily)
VTLTELYETYENKLRRYAAGLARDPHWAEDLVQDTFVRAMGHLDLLGTLKPYQQRAWLYRTLKNLFLDGLASQRRQRELVDQLAREPRSAPSLEDLVLSPDPFALIPERFREVVIQRYMLGMNSREIGEALGIPAATVRSRLHLAIQEARSRLQEEDEREESE